MKNINYCSLRFSVNFIGPSQLSDNKISMLTGAMISKLRQLYCIFDGKCLECSNRSSCIIILMMGEEFDCKQPIIRQEAICPKVLVKCSDKRKHFNENHVLRFDVLLFGEAIDFFSQFIYIFDQIGELGIGTNKCKYKLLQVTDSNNNLIYEDGYLYKNLAISDINSYISARLAGNEGFNKMYFKSPFRLHTNAAKHFFINEEVLFYHIKKRLKSLDIFEENDEKIFNKLLQERIISEINLDVMKINYLIKSEQSYEEIIGFLGYIKFINKDCIDPVIRYFLACEKMCIGSNILFGFGQYIMEG